MRGSDSSRSCIVHYAIKANAWWQRVIQVQGSEQTLTETFSARAEKGYKMLQQSKMHPSSDQQRVPAKPRVHIANTCAGGRRKRDKQEIDDGSLPMHKRHNPCFPHQTIWAPSVKINASRETHDTAGYAQRLFERGWPRYRKGDTQHPDPYFSLIQIACAPSIEKGAPHCAVHSRGHLRE